MLRPGLLLGILFFSSICLGQQGYSVSYTYDPNYFPITFNGEKRQLPAAADRLVFNDSLSFWYRLGNGSPKKNGVYGKKPYHHGIFSIRIPGLLYHVVAWPKNKPVLLIADTVRTEKWVYGNDIKMILGYRCRQALSVNEKNDSTLVWFTGEIPFPYGPAGYLGVPGLVLEVYDQQFGRHLFATKLEEGEFKVALPDGSTIISRAEYVSPKK